MIDVEGYRARLIERKRELERRLGRIDEDLGEQASPDWEERATEREDDEVLEDLVMAGRAELRMIDAALKRIEAGEFGHCVNCGEEISEARLSLIPHAARCRNCA